MDACNDDSDSSTIREKYIRINNSVLDHSCRSDSTLTLSDACNESNVLANSGEYMRINNAIFDESLWLNPRKQPDTRNKYVVVGDSTLMPSPIDSDQQIQCKMKESLSFYSEHQKNLTESFSRKIENTHVGECNGISGPSSISNLKRAYFEELRGLAGTSEDERNRALLTVKKRKQNCRTTSTQSSDNRSTRERFSHILKRRRSSLTIEDLERTSQRDSPPAKCTDQAYAEAAHRESAGEFIEESRHVTIVNLCSDISSAGMISFPSVSDMGLPATSPGAVRVRGPRIGLNLPRHQSAMLPQVDRPLLPTRFQSAGDVPIDTRLLALSDDFSTGEEPSQLFQRQLDDMHQFNSSEEINQTVAMEDINAVPIYVDHSEEPYISPERHCHVPLVKAIPKMDSKYVMHCFGRRYRWSSICTIIMFVVTFCAFSTAGIARLKEMADVEKGDITHHRGDSHSLKLPSTSSTPLSMDRFNSIMNILQIMHGEERFSNVYSAQYKALDWISNLDLAQIPINDVERITQRYILALVYFSTNQGLGWDSKLDFLDPSHECSWNGRGKEDARLGPFHGVYECDSNDQVKKLYLGNNNLKGNIPDEIGDLSLLDTLILSENRLTGYIPESLGNITGLSWLDLGWNDLSGSIPTALWNLSLSVLELHNNILTGSIPSKIGSLNTSLVDLYLDNNRLTGTLPDILQTFYTLEYFTVQENFFEGNISFICQNEYTDMKVFRADCRYAIQCDCCTLCF